MQSPTILLFGIGGVYNYGCEAIVRGTEVILREGFPNARILYASVRPEDDRKRLIGSQIEIVARQLYGAYSPRNVFRRACRCLRLGWAPLGECLDYARQADMVLSIGGDLYTLCNEAGTLYNEDILDFGDAIHAMRKPLVLWGASIGPFEKNGRAKRIFVKHLKAADLITCREPATTQYLNHVGVTANTIQCADPAFAMPGVNACDHRSHSRPLIGINLSPLSVLAASSSAELGAHIERQAATIKSIVEDFDADIVLVPHVSCDFREIDDDVRYLRRIAAVLGPSCGERIRALPPNIGFMETRREIARCDVMVAARMHAAINAMGSGVPTLLLSYSQKAAGMAEYVYGHRKWVLPIGEFTSTRFMQQLEALLASASGVREYLRFRNVTMQLDARRSLPALLAL